MADVAGLSFVHRNDVLSLPAGALPDRPEHLGIASDLGTIVPTSRASRA
jgi:hypothetical protein